MHLHVHMQETNALLSTCQFERRIPSVRRTVPAPLLRVQRVPWRAAAECGLECGRHSPEARRRLPVWVGGCAGRGRGAAGQDRPGPPLLL